MNITGINAPFNCDNVFTNTNFGQDQDVDRINKNCLYLNSTTLLILLGQGATILPGDNLTLIDGSSVQVAPPINPLIPQVQIIVNTNRIV